MNSCQRQEKINIEFLKELVRSGKYDKKQFEDKLRQEGETWASAMRYYIQHAHEPKVYTKGRNRSDVYGRDYCNTSIQRLPKEIREQVMTDYADIDIEAAAQTCLVVLLRVLNIEVDNVFYEYIENKQAIRERLQTKAIQNQSNIDIKSHITALTFGGAPADFQDDFLSRYKGAMDRLIRKKNLISEEDLEAARQRDKLKQRERDNLQLRYSCLSEIIYRIESQIIYTLEDHLCDVLGYRRKYSILLYDGIFVHVPTCRDEILIRTDLYEEDYYRSAEITIEDLNMLCDDVKQKLGVSIKLSSTYAGQKIHSTQPFDKMELSRIPNVCIARSDPEEHEYKTWKEAWEKDNKALKILNPPLFVVAVGERENIYTRNALVDAFEHVAHVKRWLRDPDICTKSRVGCYPGNCPADVYNTWKPFAIQTWKDVSDMSEDKEAVEFFLEHLRMLCNYEEAPFRGLLHFIADMLQRPEVKAGIALIMTGAQGAGKSSVIEVLKKLLGSEKHFESTKPQEDVWGKFNPLMNSAYLVEISEVDQRSTWNWMGEIKSQVTAPQIKIRDLCKSPFVVDSYHRYMILTNNTDPMPHEHGQRRFLHVHTSSKYKGNKEYFKKFYSYIVDNRRSLYSIYMYLLRVTLPSRLDVDEYASSYQREIARESTPVHLAFLQRYVRSQLQEATAVPVGQTPQTTLRVYHGVLFKEFTDMLRELRIKDDWTTKKFGTKMASIAQTYSLVKDRDSRSTYYDLELEKLNEELNY